MGAVCVGSAHYCRFRRGHNRWPEVGHARIWPDSRIRFRPQLDADWLGYRAEPGTGITKGRVGRDYGPAASGLVRVASV